MSCYDKMTSVTGMQQTNNHGRLVLYRKKKQRLQTALLALSFWNAWN